MGCDKFFYCSIVSKRESLKINDPEKEASFIKTDKRSPLQQKTQIMSEGGKVDWRVTSIPVVNQILVQPLLSVLKCMSNCAVSRVGKATLVFALKNHKAKCYCLDATPIQGLPCTGCCVFPGTKTFHYCRWGPLCRQDSTDILFLLLIDGKRFIQICLGVG